MGKQNNQQPQIRENIYLRRASYELKIKEPKLRQMLRDAGYKPERARRGYRMKVDDMLEFMTGLLEGK